ncbi:hypothetical protein ACWEU6_11665 [Streptosporangium sandarakinum]|uniref:hypothetical protein n=1 Tax=Streptosporangium sandarakinum TaxID=1260955 RepID=UPI0036C3B885
MQFTLDRLTHRIVLWPQSELLIAPVFVRVQPHRAADQMGGLPFVARPHMRMKEGIGVAEDLQVHSPKRWV